MKRIPLLLTTLALLLGGVGQAQAGMITWGSIQNATGNASDVVTTGTFVSSYTLHSSNLTLNGITFDSPSNSTISLSGGAVLPYSTAPPTTWDSTYQQLLNQGYQAPHSTFTIALTGLTSGQQYEVQIWTPYWNSNWQTEFDGVSTAGTDSSGPLNLGVTEPNFNVISQYVTGTFTASGTTQTIYAIGAATQVDDYQQLPTVAALDVLALSPAASVPEPSTLTLLGLGSLGLLGYGWRRRNRAEA